MCLAQAACFRMVQRWCTDAHLRPPHAVSVWAAIVQCLPCIVSHACAGLLVQSFTQDGRFPTYCPGGTQPDPVYGYTVDKYSTVNVEEITINSELSWYCAGNVSTLLTSSSSCKVT